MAGLEPARTFRVQRILSPLRLPFRHIGARQQASVPRTASLQAQNGYFQNTKPSVHARRYTSISYSTGNFSSTCLATGFGTGSVRSVLIPHDFKLSGMSVLINFSSKNRYFFRSLDTDLNRISVDPGHFDMDKSPIIMPSFTFLDKINILATFLIYACESSLVRIYRDSLHRRKPARAICD